MWSLCPRALMTRSIFWGCLLSEVLSGRSFAAPVIENLDRLEINWSSQRVRFFGTASTKGLISEGDIKGAERKAWRDGLNYLSQSVRDLYVMNYESMVDSPEKLTESAAAAARSVSRSTSSYNTAYYQSGDVRVFLENNLAKVFEPMAGLRFRQKEAGNIGTMEKTGILFQLERSIKPRPFYTVIDENGQTLMDVRDLAEDSYRKNLMGRWYRRASNSETLETVGANPIIVVCGVDHLGRFVVAKELWEKAIFGYKALIVSGAMMIALP